MQRAIIAIEHVIEDGVGWMKKNRQIKRCAARIETLHALLINMRISADGAGQIDADQTQSMNSIVQHIHRDFLALEGDGCAGEEASGMTALGGAHFLVPENG